MKSIFTICVLWVGLSYGYCQCTLSGLQPFYCTSDSGSQLSASCTGGSANIVGSGVNATGYFNPAQAGLDSVPVIVLEGTTTYTIDQSGTYDTIGVPSNASSVTLSDDAVIGNLNIGFTFRFFDNLYTTFGISSNGFIYFGSNTENGCCSGHYMPGTQTPNNVAAFAWEDLNPANGGQIKYFTYGVAPNRRLVMCFIDIQHYGGGYPVTSQVHLIEGCGRIEIHTTSMPSDGGSHTMGIENSNGTTAYPVSGRNASSWTITNDFVAFQPNCGDTFWTVVSDGPDLIVTTDSNDCFSDSTATVSVSASGASPFSYEWSTGATTSSVNNLPFGTYTVTVTDDNGCETYAEADVYSPSPLGLNLNVSNAICEGQSNGEINVNASGGVPPYSYSWSTGATTSSLSNIAVGSYTVTITDANGCESSSSASVGFQFADPIVQLGEDKLICPGKIALLVATPGYANYDWSTGDSTSSIVVTGPGIYSLTVTTSNGCTGSDEITVVEAVPVQVDLGPNKEGLSPITVDAGAQFTQYLWSTGSTAQSITVATSGTYAVTVADTNGCSTSDDVKVSIWPASVEDVEEGEFSVFPNPASDEITIVSGTTHKALDVSIVDMVGKQVLNDEISINSGQSYRLDVSGLAPGNYQLVFRSESTVRRRAIVIQ